ncbi:MAG: hypothetical protein HQK83_05570 [Fibrobacteria bacterium]|nr:hypothetical protein [Fibrobacteria bacterium]
MNTRLPDCWEIMDCHREKGGTNLPEPGECIASKKGLGHSCWTIAGTQCGGKIQGSVAQKENNCMQCKVYKKYHRVIGTDGKAVTECYPEEESAYLRLLRQRVAEKRLS